MFNVENKLAELAEAQRELGKLNTMNQILAYVNKRPNCIDDEFRGFLIDLSNECIRKGRGEIIPQMEGK